MFTTSEQLLYKEISELNFFGQVLKMKLLLVIILYLQLLHQQEAAPFDDIEENESPPYDYNVLSKELERGATIEKQNNVYNPKFTEDSFENEAKQSQVYSNTHTALEKSTYDTEGKDNNRIGKGKSELEDELPLDDTRDEENQWPNKRDFKLTKSYKRMSKGSNAIMQASQTKCKLHLSNINTKQYSMDFMIGGNSGHPVTINANGENHGRIVRKLKFWLSNNQYLTMETELSDGTNHNCGAWKSRASETFYFRPDERITYLNIYTENNDCTSYVTGISFSTNKGRYLRLTGGRAKYYYQTRRFGSEILVGFKARCGVHVNAIAFLFLQKVESSALTHVHYPNINSLSILEKPFHINGMKCNNKGRKVEEDFTLSGSRSIHDTHQWSLGTTSLEAQLSNTKVKARIVSVSMPTGTSLTSSLAMSSPYYHGRELNISSTQNYAFNIKVPPGKEVIATATAYQGVIETPYTGRLTVKLITGRTFNYQVTGVYRSKTTSNVVVSTKDII